MPLLYIEKTPASIRTAFTQKVESISAFLGIHPDWLMQVMWAESKLKSTAANRQGADKHLVAAGLLQFTLGSGIVKAGKVQSIEHILSMSALIQLDLVKWYFTPYKGKMKSYYDVYAVTFFPAMIGKPDDWVLQTKSLSAATIAKQNKGIAKGKSHITVADFKRYAVGLVPESFRERVFGVVKKVLVKVADEVDEVKDIIVSHPKESTGVGAGFIVGLCLIGWFLIKKG
ncbi:MAG: hypothetical protein ABI169_14545 [Chitinophagaceae bacterium]